MKKALLIGLLLLMATTVAFAQGTGQAKTTFGQYGGVITAGFALGIAAAACGIAQGKAVSSACEGVARNPGAAKTIQLFMILGLAFIESLVLYVLLIAFQALKM
ncbi:MAG: ATP synthase F0 subunit C [Acidobacteriia bacterium]|nr:ATP synthase F0 subunit C [Terriglobia bacterium]